MGGLLRRWRGGAQRLYATADDGRPGVSGLMRPQNMRWDAGGLFGRNTVSTTFHRIKVPFQTSIIVQARWRREGARNLTSTFVVRSVPGRGRSWTCRATAHSPPRPDSLCIGSTMLRINLSTSLHSSRLPQGRRVWSSSPHLVSQRLLRAPRLATSYAPGATFSRQPLHGGLRVPLPQSHRKVPRTSGRDR